MNWFKALFSSGTAKVVDSVGNALDGLFTSDEERLDAQDRIEKTKMEVKKIMMDFEREQLKHIERVETELSNRHKEDMRSDSWLSKNIRPMTLIFLTLAMVVLAYMTTFDSDLTQEQIKVLESWSSVLMPLLMMVYGFYFGSRGLEKIFKIRAEGDKARPQG